MKDRLNFCTPGSFTRKQVILINQFRVLWEEHDVWTRDTISGIVFDLPNTNVVIERLLRNPVDFARIFRQFYGKSIAKRFRDLLREHLVLAAELVTAAKAGDTQATNEAERKWYKNANQIACFLSKINHFWSKNDWKEMMHMHLKLVKAEAVYLLNEDYEANVSIYDKIEAQTLEMADELARGIIKQFCVE